MKITKENLKLFDRFYREFVNDLIEDLTFYKVAYMQNLKSVDLKALNINSAQELMLLSKQAILHRLDLFKEREISGDDAVNEAKKLLDGEE